MLTSKTVLTGVAALASLLAVALLSKQARAETCPVDSRRVGVIATFLGHMLDVASLCLLV